MGDAVAAAPVRTPHYAGPRARHIAMTEPTPTALIELIYTEALALDEQRWDDWLALYRDDAVFWIPSWKAEHRPTEDPATEVSFIYISGRQRLEERVRRVIGGKSIASMPLPRTLHCISNPLPQRDQATWRIRSNCTTQLYDPRSATLKTMVCRYEHTVASEGDTLLIASKKIILINDRVPTVLDFYCV